MAVSKAQQRATNKYKKSNYDRVELVVPKGRKEEIRVHAESKGQSVNGFIIAAVDEKMERDGGANKVAERDLIRPGGGEGVTNCSPLQRAADPGAAPAERVLAETVSTSPQGAAETAQGAEGISLPPDTLKAVQRAVERTGEAVAVFIARAVDLAVEMDERQRWLGISLSKGGMLQKTAAAPTMPAVPVKAPPVKLDPEKITVELRRIFRGMELRCYDPDIPDYAEFGAKGVVICDEWRGDGGFTRFMEWCIKNGFRPGLIIGRKDGAGPYSPENCVLKARKES